MMPIPLHLARSDKICVVIRRTISLLRGPFKQDTMCTAQISREETSFKTYNIKSHRERGKGI